jgi:hypothetical protein
VRARGRLGDHGKVTLGVNTGDEAVVTVDKAVSTRIFTRPFPRRKKKRKVKGRKGKDASTTYDKQTSLITIYR